MGTKNNTPVRFEFKTESPSMPRVKHVVSLATWRDIGHAKVRLNWRKLGYIPQSSKFYYYPNRSGLVSNNVKSLHATLNQICPIKGIAVAPHEICVVLYEEVSEAERMHIEELLIDMLLFQLSA